MTDFRHSDNPHPFARLGMEGDESPLTEPEREALLVLTREAVRFAALADLTLGSSSRGVTAQRLAGLTEVIDSARAAMARAQHAERAAEGRQA
jgi:hypothetical protein